MVRASAGGDHRVAGVVVGGGGDDGHPLAHRAGRAREHAGLLLVEPLRDERRAQTQAFGRPDLVDEIPRGVGVAGQSVEAELGEGGRCGHAGEGSNGRRGRIRALAADTQAARSLTGDSISGRDRRRSGDLTLFRRALYQLSYPTSPRRTEVADLTGFEPATSGLTGRRALQTAPQVPNQHRRWGIRHPQRDSNPCYRLERAAS